MTRIIVAVTNDLTYDQRMQRVCASLAVGGYQVTLVGRRRSHSVPLVKRSYHQRRMRCLFDKGPLFYAEYNIRLCVLLLLSGYDIAVACDLDTALAVRIACRIKGRRSVFDAHELFTEVPELISRTRVQRIWSWIGKQTVPHFDARYTVGNAIAEAHELKYHAPFHVIRNTPQLLLQNVLRLDQREPVIFYQGALNAGRGLEYAIDAMAALPDYRLELAGEGDLSDALRQRARERDLGGRVAFHGWVQPEELPKLAGRALVGLNLLESNSRSYYLSLANKFFDYMHAGLPSVNMDFPEYRMILQQDPVGITCTELTTNYLAVTLQELLTNRQELEAMIAATQAARQRYQWEIDERKLLEIYRSLLPE